MTQAREQPICEAFSCIADLCLALGEAPLTKHSNCWEYQVDSRWWLAVNGHKEAKMCSQSTSPIEPFTAYVTFNGWPAFSLHAYGGFGAAGALANENTFIDALRVATIKASNHIGELVR